MRTTVDGLVQLAVLLAFLVGLSDEAALAQSDTPAKRAAINIAAPRTADDARPVIGAYYYPWYGVNDRPLDHDWHNVMRRKLDPPQEPLAGLYRSDDAKVIEQHLDQSRQAGIDFWAVSWWGPDSGTDRTFREAILKHPRADQLRYAVLYESTGRLGPLDGPRYDHLRGDFAYLREHYFSDPSYLKVDGRPVVFIYLSREYFRGRGLEQLAELRRDFPDLYLIGDDVFGGEYRAEWAAPFDAVTAYDVYGQSAHLHRATRRATQTLADNYAHARQQANSVERAFVPAVAPGYNDSAVRAGHPGAARYFVDVPNSQEGDLFRAMIRQAALPNLDDRCGRLLMVTSFNEWYEDTQIEASAGTAGATSQDTSVSGSRFSFGDRYEDYGPLYLDILRNDALGKPIDP